MGHYYNADGSENHGTCRRELKEAELEDSWDDLMKVATSCRTLVSKEYDRMKEAELEDNKWWEDQAEGEEEIHRDFDAWNNKEAKKRVKEIYMNGTMTKEEYEETLPIESVANIDVVNDPSHYTKGVEVLQYVHSQDLNFACGNAVKYITRARHKGKAVQDLAKALFYVAYELEQNGGNDDITKFAERWLRQKTMLTRTYVVKET